MTESPSCPRETGSRASCRCDALAEENRVLRETLREVTIELEHARQDSPE